MEASSSTPRFRWLRTAEEAFALMLQAIDDAKEAIRLETYIYNADQAGGQFRDALVRARQRGVRVYVLVDAFGSVALPASFWEPLSKLGGEFAWFNPLSLNRWSYRDHRKLLICDTDVAFIGGFNIGDEYYGDGITKGWRDLGMQINSCPLTADLAESFDVFYLRAAFKHKRLQRLRQAQTKVTTGQNWALLLSGPGRRHSELKRTLIQDLSKARDVRIICAYFLPTWRLRKELMNVCRRGGRVQLILAGKSDVALSQLASRRLYRMLLKAGIEIFEYQPQILHGKLIVIDDAVYVGSANLDTRSLRINYELVVRLTIPRVVGEAREIFDSDLQHCKQITRAQWRQTRTLWQRIKQDWAYFVLAKVDPYFAQRQLKNLQTIATRAMSSFRRK